MFAGHLGAALAAKKAAPNAPLSALVAASFGVDLLWPVLVLVGLESVRIAPEATAFTPLAFDSYPWSHSLAMVLVWGLVAAAVSLLVGLRAGAAVVVGLVLVSHWALDAVTHRPDLPLWPGGPEVGLGLWRNVPATLFFEGIVVVLGLWLYLTVSRPKDRRGRVVFHSLVAVVVLVWALSPLAPPPPGPTAVAVSALGLFILPFWAGWAERHRLTRRDGVSGAR